jgi:hypothetical protein
VVYLSGLDEVTFDGSLAGQVAKDDSVSAAYDASTRPKIGWSRTPVGRYRAPTHTHSVKEMPLYTK